MPVPVARGHPEMIPPRRHIRIMRHPPRPRLLPALILPLQLQPLQLIAEPDLLRRDEIEPRVIELQIVLPCSDHRRRRRLPLVPCRKRHRRRPPVHQQSLQPHIRHRFHAVLLLRIDHHNPPRRAKTQPPVLQFQPRGEVILALLRRHPFRIAEQQRMHRLRPARRHLRQRALVHPADAPVTAQPQVPLVILQNLQHIVVRQSLPLRETRQPPPRPFCQPPADHPDPQCPLPVQMQRADQIARQPVLRCERGQLPPLPPQQPAAHRPDPQRPVRRLRQRRDPGLRQPFHFHEPPVPQPLQLPVVSPDPYPALPVLAQRQHPVPPQPRLMIKAAQHLPVLPLKYRWPRPPPQAPVPRPQHRSHKQMARERRRQQKLLIPRPVPVVNPPPRSPHPEISVRRLRQAERQPLHLVVPHMPDCQLPRIQPVQPPRPRPHPQILLPVHEQRAHRIIRQPVRHPQRLENPVLEIEKPFVQSPAPHRPVRRLHQIVHIHRRHPVLRTVPRPLPVLPAQHHPQLRPRGQPHPQPPLFVRQQTARPDQFNPQRPRHRRKFSILITQQAMVQR